MTDLSSFETLILFFLLTLAIVAAVAFAAGMMFGVGLSPEAKRAMAEQKT